MNETISIKNEEIDNIVMDIMDYAERINKVFSQMDDLVTSSYDSFDFSYQRELKNYFEELKPAFSVTVQNILNYVEDLKLAKANFGHIDDMAAHLMRRQTLEWTERKNTLLSKSATEK